MNELVALSVKGFLITGIMMALLWLIHLKIKNAGIVDFGWALGLAMLGGFYACVASGYPQRRILVAVMALVWGLRLASHILFDRVVGKPEDGRYTTLRKEWKTDLPRKFFLFFEFQALLDVLLSLPFLLMAVNPYPKLGPIEWVGFALWFIALVGESVADAQLKSFKRDPASKGKTCRRGLWNYSRHPNYFFEWLIWVAFFIAALGSPWGFLSIMSPILMLYFLFKVTGIPGTEAQALKSRGDDYRDYQRTTSAFIPWFKKKSA